MISEGINMKENRDIKGLKRDENGRFIPGTCGGNGRPKGSVSLLEILKAQLKKKPKGERRTYAQLIIQKILEQAIRGNETQIRLIWNYLHGLPKESIESSGDVVFRVERMNEGKDENNDTTTPATI